MRSQAAAGIAALSLLVSPGTSPQEQSTTYAELDTILVTGEQPGPPLWKVTNGDHVLWIMPLVDMYPRKVEWDSARVEKLIAGSQEYISRPRTLNSVSVTNPLAVLRVAGLITRSTQLPKGRTLADEVPADLYQRYRRLKSRYFPRNTQIETRTVGRALSMLQDEILEDENLEMLWYGRTSSPGTIMNKLQKWMKANKTIRRVQVDVGINRHLTSKELKSLGRLMDESRASPEHAAWQLDCFDKVVTYFEHDLESVKRRANAWARGSIEALLERTPLYVGTRNCGDAPAFVADGPEATKLRKGNPALLADLTPDLEALMQQAKQMWLTAAEAALERNTSTFSMLHMDDILDEDGLVAQLEAKGFLVEVSAE